MGIRSVGLTLFTLRAYLGQPFLWKHVGHKLLSRKMDVMDESGHHSFHQLSSPRALRPDGLHMFMSVP
eukprot:3927770-Lingulodinium_polyedra.AAC.1